MTSPDAMMKAVAAVIKDERRTTAAAVKAATDATAELADKVETVSRGSLDLIEAVMRANWSQLELMAANFDRDSVAVDHAKLAPVVRALVK